jgi:hypothetical protein
MRTPATNPFTLTIKTLQGVVDTIQDIRGNMLDSLSSTVKQFNGLWHNNASVAFEVGRGSCCLSIRQGTAAVSVVCRLLVAIHQQIQLQWCCTTGFEHGGIWHVSCDSQKMCLMHLHCLFLLLQSLLNRAAHLNHTVLELPRDVESKVLLVNASVADFMKLYNSQDSLLTLPQRIQDAGAKLSMPDASSLLADLKLAEAQLNEANGLPELITKLATLARALDKTLRDAKSNIQPSLDAFAADNSMRMDLADTLTFEGPVVLGAASLFESANLGGFKDTVRTVLAKLDATIEPARREADAIPGVLQQISEFDVIAKFTAPLQQAEAVYKEFGGNPSEVRTDPLVFPAFPDCSVGSATISIAGAPKMCCSCNQAALCYVVFLRGPCWSCS